MLPRGMGKSMSNNQDLKSKLEEFASQKGPTLADSLGIEFLTVSTEKVSARMPVDQRTIQPQGLLHGGASIALAETLASIGGWLQVEADGKTVVGQEINANHLRAVRSGYVTGTAEPIHLGGRSQVWQIKIENDQGKLICISRCTLSVITPKSTSA